MVAAAFESDLPFQDRETTILRTVSILVISRTTNESVPSKMWASVSVYFARTRMIGQPCLFHQLVWFTAQLTKVLS